MKQMRQELVQAWDVLGHQARAEVHAPHSSEMAAAAEAQQGSAAAMSQEQAVLEERTQARRSHMARVQDHAASGADRRKEAKVRTANVMQEIQEEFRHISRRQIALTRRLRWTCRLFRACAPKRRHGKSCACGFEWCSGRRPTCGESRHRIGRFRPSQGAPRLVQLWPRSGQL